MNALMIFFLVLILSPPQVFANLHCYECDGNKREGPERRDCELNPAKKDPGAPEYSTTGDRECPVPDQICYKMIKKYDDDVVERGCGYGSRCYHYSDSPTFSNCTMCNTSLCNGNGEGQGGGNGLFGVIPSVILSFSMLLTFVLF